MKRIYKNNDLVFSVKLDDTVKDFNLKFYTIKESNCIVKSNKDVVENKVILQWDELKNLEEGVMYYDYILYSPNLEMNDGKVDEIKRTMSNYYICSGIGELDDDADLYNYYTKEQVDELLDNVVVGTIDLSNYYTKSQVDIKLGDYIEEDVLGSYYTKNEVNDLIDNIDIPTTDLTNYYKKSETYSKTEVNNLIDGLSTGDGEINLNNYYTKEEVDSKIPTDYIKSIPSEYITETELNKSLSGYSKSSHTHNYLSSIPSEYITETELNAKGYLTQHQSLTNYYTKGEVDSKIPTDYITGNDLGKYITEDELNDMNFATKSELPSEYDDTSIVNRITALETELTGVSEQITELNNMVV